MSTKPLNLENQGIMMIETPVNMLLSGCYGLSHAYRSLKDRLPEILAKVIDTCSREKNNDNENDIKIFIAAVSKLRYDLVTNKPYATLSSDLPDTNSWNTDIDRQENKTYFNNTFLFTECYVYRRMWDECMKLDGIKNYDYFAEMKNKSLYSSIEPMCIFADKLIEMLHVNSGDNRKQDFITLLEFCLWANNSDLSLSGGKEVSPGEECNDQVVDPIKLMNELKNKILVNDSEKIYEDLFKRAELLENENKNVVFDIVCDNAGYELFSDLSLGLFLVEQKIVNKVRFHLKNVPWFVSDTMPADFSKLIDFCSKVRYERLSHGISVNSLRKLAQKWRELLDSGTFEVQTNYFWMSAHVYKDMKTVDNSLYTKLKSSLAIMFKGDLNYRKLLGEKRVVDTISFEDALQGFHPAPVLSVRTVKCEIICNLKPNVARQLSDLDWRWMEKGHYGVIHHSSKIES